VIPSVWANYPANAALHKPTTAIIYYADAVPAYVVDGLVLDYPYIWHSARFDTAVNCRLFCVAVSRSFQGLSTYYTRKQLHLKLLSSFGGHAQEGGIPSRLCRHAGLIGGF
jgi:hypothetical protein